MVEFLSLFFFSSWMERNILCEYYIAAFYPTMSSKSTQQTKKAKKTPAGKQTRKSRPLSPGAATFEALNNPAYDTSVKHFSPPMPVPPSPPRLQNLGITGPSPPRRIRSLDDMPRSPSTDEDDPLDRKQTRTPNIFKAPFKDEDEDEEELAFSFASVPAPDVPLRDHSGGRTRRRRRRRRRTIKRSKTRRRRKRRAVTRGKKGRKRRQTR